MKTGIILNSVMKIMKKENNDKKNNKKKKKKKKNKKHFKSQIIREINF